MKKLSVIVYIITAMLVAISCNDVKRTPGRDYMPDMRYSRAYETYAPHENLRDLGINYTGMPVSGTIKRGEYFPFSITKDKEGDSINYVASRQVANPLPMLDTLNQKEVERLYLINCGICHGTKLDGNGPLYNNGNGPYPAAPKNLIADPQIVAMPDGQMFYSITYGKGLMGPYGSQLTTTQRWQIVHYINMKQGMGKGGGTAKTDSTSAAPANNDTTKGSGSALAAPAKPGK